MEIHKQRLSEKDREQEAFQSTVKNQHFSNHAEASAAA
jgi:hypothetical protein